MFSTTFKNAALSVLTATVIVTGFATNPADARGGREVDWTIKPNTAMRLQDPSEQRRANAHPIRGAQPVRTEDDAPSTRAFQSKAAPKIER